MPPRPKEEITPEALYLRRREFMRNAGFFGLTAAGVGASLLALTGGVRGRPKPASGGEIKAPALPGPAARDPRYTVNEPVTSFASVTTYNNFYEFGLDKGDPAQNAGSLRTRPWTVTIDGEVKRPEVVDIDQLIKSFPLQERVYRMRCVEA